MISSAAIRSAAPEPEAANYLLDDSLAAAIEINSLIQRYQDDPCSLGMAVMKLRNKNTTGTTL